MHSIIAGSTPSPPCCDLATTWLPSLNALENGDFWQFWPQMLKPRGGKEYVGAGILLVGMTTCNGSYPLFKFDTHDWLRFTKLLGYDRFARPSIQALFADLTCTSPNKVNFIEILVPMTECPLPNYWVTRDLPGPLEMLFRQLTL